MPDYTQYLQTLRSHGAAAEVDEYAQVQENGRTYPLIRVTVAGEPKVVITAGFHGEEPAGPLTLAHHLSAICAYARRQGVGLLMFPCINPSGFEAGTRYNASGERPNNDFLRYEVSPGQWKGELVDGEPFLRWQLFDGGPKETKAVRTELERHPVPMAALDLHQDNYLGRPAAYAYVFGDAGHYSPLMKRTSQHAKIAMRWGVDDHHKTDALGMVRYHDGSITDYFLRRGVPYTAALETTTKTALDACHRINLTWIEGFIDLAAASAQPRSP
ncbi:MAG: M14 family zinc carboxypeptidase [Myxococcota bacterium]